MDLVLMPRFWLGVALWDEAAGTLRSAGHAVRALTVPGLESCQADPFGHRRDHLEALVAVPDSVVLVGHSGGGPEAQASTGARRDRSAGVIYVDSHWPAT